ncbi:MAG: hypothetical protein KKA64_03745 [Nanoarchaeota archaeon]|nr:hypothetical protein [Nanoarchaeota archaeon]
MTQKLLGATGIVGVLILAGIILANTGINQDASQLAIKSGITLGIIFGGLGVIGILVTLSKRVF